MEKGGKGFSLPPQTARKSSLKSNPQGVASLKGKDDSSTKSKRGKKVQFNFEGSPEANFSPKSGGKDETTFPKGDSSKWGKSDKTSTGGKNSISKEPQPLEFKIEQELPENAKCMMDCEAVDILQGIKDQMVILTRDPEFRLLYHLTKGCSTPKGVAITQIPSLLDKFLIVEFLTGIRTLTKYGVTDGEICLIANVCPESVDEVFALVPTLKPKRTKLSEPLQDVLSELAKLKESASLESQMERAQVDIPDN